MKRGMLAALVVLALAPAVFALSPLRADAAFQACACRCIERAETETTRINDAADCHAACLADLSGHTAEQLAGSSRVRTTSGQNRCQCEWSVPTTLLEWTPKTAGRTSCDGDCAAVCEGAANIDPAQQQTGTGASGNTRTVDCTRDDHCAQGVFAVYAQRNNCTPGEKDCGAPYCEYQTVAAGTANAYDGIRPRCIIPATALNADIECQSYGGDARGGVCRKFDPGENLAQYVITRPYVSGGEYTSYNFFRTATSYPTVENFNSQLNRDRHAPSLCELYGETQDVVIGIQTPTNSDYTKNVVGVTFGEANLPAGAQPLSVSASKRYVCSVKKIDTCGTVKPEATDTIQTAMAYKCIDPVNFSGNVESLCFSETRSENELCVNSPGTRCCAEAAGGCYSDGDCILPKKCVKTTHSTLGTCQYVTVCDDENASRRCRAATLTERANPNICSAEIVPGTSRCGTGTMACCGPTPSNLLSPCAADLINETVIIDGHQTQFTPAMAGGYSCFDMSELRKLPATEGSSIWMESGPDTILRPFADGGVCLTNNDPAALKSGAPSVQRCSGAQSVCCNAAAVGNQRLIDEMNNRPGSGASCGPSGKGFACTQFPSISETVLNRFGFQNAWSYQTALAASPYCQITPVFGSSYTNSRECQSGMVCCASYALSSAWCATDANCSANGQECDKVIHHCVPVGSREKRAASNCVEAARSEGEADVEAVAAPGTESTFSCQRVADADGEANRTLCLQRGCDGEAEAGEGYSFRCCAPGTGQAPGAASAAVANPQIEVQAAPGAIRWAACISSGSCTIDEIIASGASFANFLISISGSVFLAIFVYAGFIYLTAGSTNRVETAKKMLRQATIGMVLLLGAYVLIQFIQQTFMSNALNASKAATCGHTPETNNGSYMCTWLNADASNTKALQKEISDKKCIRNLCPDDKAANYVCCPTQVQE